LATNDWFTGLIPAYAKLGAFGDIFMGTTFIHIIHNLDPSYEGRIYSNNQKFSHIHNLPDDLLINPF